MTEPKPPPGLGAAARRLWQGYMDAYELDAGETVVLGAACRTADEVESLQAALRDVQPITRGSTGQPRMHPGYEELRRHRTALAALLKQLQPEPTSSGVTASEGGRLAARARWSKTRPRLVS